MQFALDLVWLDEGGRVLAAVEDAPPCETSPCPLYEPKNSERAVAVLELPAGRAEARHRRRFVRSPELRTPHCLDRAEAREAAATGNK